MSLELLYDSPRARVYLGDAREVLRSLDDESVDLVVTDPPYGVSQIANTRKEKFKPIVGDTSSEEAASLLASVAPDLVRVTRRSRHLYVFGLALNHEYTPFAAELIWDKGRVGSGNMQAPWGPQHEPIFFHVRAPDKHNAEKGTGVLAARMRKGSVISVRRMSAMQVRRHPTEKPVALMAELVESSSRAGELVLDPFAGVGSTGVAALLRGRRTTLIELDPGYAAIAVERVREAERIAGLMEAA